MAQSIARILQTLQRMGGFSIIDLEMKENRDTHHQVMHSFANEIIVPLAAITNNIDFFLCNGVKHIFTADRVECRCVYFTEKHVCDLEEDVKRLYHTDTWSFINKWHKYLKDMDSMHFVIMKLEK